jgi:hypothetical protein
MACTTTITGFHQDSDGEWVAELACGHSQHVRHRPPWQNRPWVTIPTEREAKLGTPIECSACDKQSRPMGSENTGAAAK